MKFNSQNLISFYSTRWLIDWRQIRLAVKIRIQNNAKIVPPLQQLAPRNRNPAIRVSLCQKCQWDSIVNDFFDQPHFLVNLLTSKTLHFLPLGQISCTGVLSMMTLTNLPRVDGDIGDRARLIGLRISKKKEYFQKLKPTVLSRTGIVRSFVLSFVRSSFYRSIIRSFYRTYVRSREERAAVELSWVELISFELSYEVREWVSNLFEVRRVKWEHLITSSLPPCVIPTVPHTYPTELTVLYSLTVNLTGAVTGHS